MMHIKEVASDICSGCRNKRCLIGIFDGKNIFDQPVKNDLITYGNILKIATGQGDDYTTGCWLDYNFLKIHYKMIATALRKKQALDAHPKTIQQISFTPNLDRAGYTTMFFIIKEAKDNILDFLQGIVKTL